MIIIEEIVKLMLSKYGAKETDDSDIDILVRTGGLIWIFVFLNALLLLSLSSREFNFCINLLQGGSPRKVLFSALELSFWIY